MATYKTMTIDHLGDNATDDDLDLFRRACAIKQASTGWTDEKVSEWMWNNGDWHAAVTAMGL